MFGQIGEIDLLLRRWFVVDAQTCGCLAAIELLEGKVLCDGYVHISLFVNGFYFVFARACANSLHIVIENLSVDIKMPRGLIDQYLGE